MAKKLAIKGHSTRGQEVIEILTMMGGHATIINKISNETDKAFFISDNENCFYRKSIRFIPDSSKELEEFKVFTLEEFLEQYPHKVGELKDLVDDHISCVITEMRWNELDECIEYHAEFGSNDYGWYRAYEFCSDYQIEEQSEEMVKDKFRKEFCERCGSQRCSGQDDELEYCERFKTYCGESNDIRIKLDKNVNMNIEFDLTKYSYEVKDGKLIIEENKPKYPTTYEECWKVRFEVEDETTIEEFHHVSGYYSEALGALQKLFCCRDAYWKIAGEEMGLDGPWKPDYNDLNNITYYGLYNELKYSIINPAQFIFPTVEMRDAFYKNFKDLIEKCK